MFLHIASIARFGGNYEFDWHVRSRKRVALLTRLQRMTLASDHGRGLTAARTSPRTEGAVQRRDHTRDPRPSTEMTHLSNASPGITSPSVPPGSATVCLLASRRGKRSDRDSAVTSPSGSTSRAHGLWLSAKSTRATSARLRPFSAGNEHHRQCARPIHDRVRSRRWGCIPDEWAGWL